MANHHQSGSAGEPGGIDPEALGEAQRWLTRHGVAVPEPPPSPAEESRRPDDATDSRRRQGRSPGPVAQPGVDRVEDPESLARGVVLRKLAVQARTRHELDRALQAKNVPDVVADQVLDRMEEVGLVDDAAFAQDWVASRQQRRHLSRRALRRELEVKGVDREDIDGALQSVDAQDEYDAARLLAERKSRVMQGLSHEVRYRRLAGLLARRGFSGSVTAQVIAEVIAERPRSAPGDTPI